jgi:hypothetical protein
MLEVIIQSPYLVLSTPLDPSNGLHKFPYLYWFLCMYYLHGSMMLVDQPKGSLGWGHSREGGKLWRD